jgi:hypothetical protein
VAQAGLIGHRRRPLRLLPLLLLLLRPPPHLSFFQMLM